MPVNLSAPKSLLPVKGVQLATTEAGIRYKDREDMVLMVFAPDSTVAGVFTKNKFCAAPVLVAKKHLSVSQSRALLINAGNANAGTGSLGLQNAEQSCQEVAECFDFKAEQVMPFSTGVIGEQMPMEVVSKGITQLSQTLDKDNWLSAAKAIMTTDTVAKGESVEVDIEGVTVTITGITKGSGMIKPDMATMLAYVATDAAISQPLLQSMIERASEASFNRITIDSDTSTNDAAVLVATGQANVDLIASLDDPGAEKIYKAIESVFIALATAMIRDAEGATKFVKVNVSGGATEQDCEEVAYTVAHSPLVKTALFASDPNWGRILAAVGRAPIEILEIDKIDIMLNDVLVIQGGEPAATYTEEQGQAVFNQEEITIAISLGNENTAYHVWTSDLSHDYVSINADYRS